MCKRAAPSPILVTSGLLVLSFLGNPRAETLVVDWNFGSSTEGWTTGGTIVPAPTPIQYGGDGWPGIIYADCTGNDPRFVSPTVSETAASGHKVVITIATHGGSSHEMRVYWRRSGDSGFSEARSLATTYSASLGQDFKHVEVDVGESSLWSGTIQQIRVDPSSSSACSGTRFHIDSVRILDGAALPPPVLLGAVDGATVTSPRLEWLAVNGAAGYELDIDGNSVLIGNGSETSYNADLDFGLHNWKARTIDDSQLFGSWSDWETFWYVLGPSNVNVSAGVGWDIFTPQGTCPSASEAEYRYGPSIIINDDDSIDAWFSSPGDGGSQWDWIRYNRSTDGGVTWEYDWTQHNDISRTDVVLRPSPSPSEDRYSCCDPGAIRIGEYYFVAYTSAGNDIGRCNSVFVARSLTPTGVYEKWNGSGWGGDAPQPFIACPCDDDDDWGASEPSLVVRDGVLYIYYEWTAVGTRVATAQASDAAWPGNLTFFEAPAIPKVSGEDSRDVKYVDSLGAFVAVAVANRFSEDSFIDVWWSSDGFVFTRACDVADNILGSAHNVGISGTAEGHIDLARSNFVAYGYGSRPSPGEGACWATHLNPVDITFGLTSVNDENSENGLSLRNFPNPFNPVTRITFSLHATAHVSLVVYDVSGKKVCRLVDRGLPPGHHEFAWMGSDDGGRRVGSGVYFVTLKTGGQRAVRKVVLIK